MSVLVPDLKVYKAVYQKAWSYGFNKTCDINYCHVLSFYNEEILQDHIKNWLWLNEMSYNRKYENKNTAELPDMLDFRFNKQTINTYQMLKFLQCILYNIELDTIKEGRLFESPEMEIPDDKIESYKLLKKAITEISQVIINQIPDYQNAQWSSI